MAQRRLNGLQRILGTNALFSTAYGNVGSSIYYALGLVAGYALGLTPVVFLITGFVFYLTAATYAEATSMYPEAGGSSSFARHAFNEFWSFFAAWAQMLNYTITIAISAYFVPHYLGSIVEPLSFLRSAPGDIFFAIAVIALLSLINVVGVKESAGVNILLAVTDFMTQLLLVGLGLFLVLSPDVLISNIKLGVAPTWSNFLIAIPVGMVAYTGIETISNMAEEAKDAGKTVPAAIKRVVIAVFAIYAFLPLIALSALPVKQAADGSYYTLLGLPESQHGYSGDPIMGVVKTMNLGLAQGPVEIYVGLLAATILFLATNAGVIGVSRLVYSMGVHRQLPDALRRLHPKFGTPVFGIVLFGVIAALAVIPGKADFLGNMYAFGAMLSFTVAHLAVVNLRRRYPNATRPYTGPANIKIGSTNWPLFAVFGAAFTGAAFVTVTVLNPLVAAAGAFWLAAGVVFYVLYRKKLDLPLRETHKFEAPAPVLESEVAYKSVVVALVGRGFSEAALRTASNLADGERGRGLYILVPIVVPQSSALDIETPRFEREAEAVLEQAKLQFGNKIRGRWVKVRPGQFGRTVLDQAKEIQASAIVVALPPGSESSGLERSIDTILAERPCRVVLQADPHARKIANGQMAK